ncbi:protein CLT1, chloroplastic isoform X1 [Amborella trichopoda]|uniref:Uncharacterized protein n=1 Tax=Amborella trichopoda TaxID=13333 RepID=U5D886_AMBTC|nr:protein CLT1, chloroplastic isoform X1 [Amborella trichopoda]ERN18450.1 hypothetical protein AMTR_s00190p00035510 [Amborella trichopoda]|eukprot:XP_006856983.1 protein CLT1, chloroplastic isoform X1 [Amborella trichopoda]
MSTCYSRSVASKPFDPVIPQRLLNLRPSFSFHLSDLHSHRISLPLVCSPLSWLNCSEKKGILNPWSTCRFTNGRFDRVLGFSALEGRIGDLQRERSRKLEVVIGACVTMMFGVANRVLYKMALIPLKQYPFFLAQIATFGYVAIYFTILHFRYHAGIVTDEMLALPKSRLFAVGFLEALAAASGMAAGAMLPGASIPIISQTFLVWQLILSTIFLRRRYKVNQLLGCILVIVGVITTVASGSSAGQSIKETGIFWTLLMVASYLFQAADTVLKEIIFLDSVHQLKGRSIDLFVVNSYGSAFQALFLCLSFPFLSNLWGVPFHQLMSYLRDGAACFINIGSSATGCEGAPLLPVLFVITNMGFNISMLHLLKLSSAVVSCLAATFAVPLSIYAFTLPLPYIGAPSTLPPGFILGATVLVAGLLVYCLPPSLGATSKQS